MIVSLIAAMDESGGIGKHNRLPWHLLSDLKRFKKLTMGHHLVMGRKTYETIGMPLPGRRMIVVTRQKSYSPQSCLTVNTLSGAIKLAQADREKEVFITGDGELFHQAISIANKIYLTNVHVNINADVFFPKFEHNQWKLISEEDNVANASDEFVSDFKIYSRKH